MYTPKKHRIQTTISGSIQFVVNDDAFTTVGQDDYAGFFVTGSIDGKKINTLEYGPSLTTLEKAIKYAKSCLTDYRKG